MHKIAHKMDMQICVQLTQRKMCGLPHFSPSFFFAAIHPNSQQQQICFAIFIGCPQFASFHSFVGESQTRPTPNFFVRLGNYIFIFIHSFGNIATDINLGIWRNIGKRTADEAKILFGPGDGLFSRK